MISQNNMTMFYKWLCYQEFLMKQNTADPFKTGIAL